MKPDVLITWPSGCDYPLCRFQLSAFKDFFNKVIITFYDHGTPDFRGFLRSKYPEWVFLESPENSVAWRERAVNLGLDESKSDWVLFSEQDFFWKDDQFLHQVISATKLYDIIGINQGSRLHPCFLLTKRSLIDKTSRDFSVKGANLDHFSQFSKEILELGKFVDLKDLNLFSGRDWYHFSSLTWNLFRVKDLTPHEFHYLADFLVYNAYSRTARVPQDPRWVAFTHMAESLLSGYGRFLND